MRKLFTLTILILMLCSCGGVQDRAKYYRQSSAPILLETKDDAASVYFIRTHDLMHSGEIWGINISNGEYVWLVDESYRGVYLSPGEYTFKTAYAFFPESVTTTVEAGKSYYLHMRDDSVMDMELSLLSPSEAMHLILSDKVSHIEPVSKEEYEASQD